MSEETIYDQNEVKQSPMNTGQNGETNNVSEKSEKKKKTLGKVGAAAAGVAVGLGLGLSPKLVFPNNPEEDEDLEAGDESLEDGEQQEGEGEEPIEVDAPQSSGHLTGHDMDVATGVDDSMSFGQAFAAARHEVGPGGLFVWHGNTYGTYYGNEWNAMSPDDRAQYWADVNHTTAQLGPDSETEPLIDPNDNMANNGETPVGDPEPPEDPNDNMANNEETPVGDPEPPEDPNGNMANNGDEPVGEPEIPIDEPETLVLNEEDIISSEDADGDGSIDTLIVDANGNEFEDMVLDLDSDGQFDTLVIDPDLNVDDENIVEINGLEVVSDDEPGFGIEDPNLVLGEDEPEPYYPDPEFEDNTIDENPDIDPLASLTPDPDVPSIDNNMNMDDFA